MVRLKEIFKGVKYRSDSGLSDVAVRNITNDSRKVRRGDLFVAIRGYSINGYNFINDAIGRKATAIVAEKDFKSPEYIKKILVKDTRSAIPIMADNFYGHPSKKLKIVGITGTNGKTTITYLIENILKEAKKTAGVIGTINHRVKGSKTVSSNTTPGPLELESILAGMRDRHAQYVIMEVSSHSLEQNRVDRISFDVGIFTNITKEHLDYHKTVKKYFEAKAKLFKKLEKNGVAILNNDDKMVASLKHRINKKILTYGINNRSDITAKDIRLSIDSTSFFIKTPKDSFCVETKLIGRHNISNILASTAAAVALGIPLAVIKKGIESFKSVPGRLERVDSGQSFKVFVDYAHTEDALHNILGLLREVTKDGRIITVFGCGGNRDRMKRPMMGDVACRFSDRVVVTSDNPRFEDPAEIISEIEKGIRDKYTNYDTVSDRYEAIAKALKLAGKNDIVVIAGKGHERYQIIKDRYMPFDDRKVARELLKSC